MLHQIRHARAEERAELIALQLRASLADPAFPHEIVKIPGVIDVKLEWIADERVFVAENGQKVRGFLTLASNTNGDIEIEGLFVEPDCWRQGVGRALVEHALAVGQARGANRLHLIANPNAAGFYSKLGFETLEEVQMRNGTGILMQRVL